jgi:hypothetical protein
VLASARVSVSVCVLSCLYACDAEFNWRVCHETILSIIRKCMRMNF